MANIDLVKKFAPYTDEMFKAESRTDLVTCNAFDWTGAHSVAIYKIETVGLNDYKRNVRESNGQVTYHYSDGSEVVGSDADARSISRFGLLTDLSTQLEEMIVKKDRSFIFNIDKLDEEETEGQVEAGKALAREIREVIIPEYDTYVYNTMVNNAGKKENAALSVDNVYASILAGSEVLDDAEVPDTERALIVTPKTYTLLKQAAIFDNTDVGAEMRKKGVVGIVDGMAVVKVPAVRLPKDFGFMIAHPSATVAPKKLEDYGVHNNTPLSSGTIVTGRFCYDAFVLENKAAGIYYHSTAEE